MTVDKDASGILFLNDQAQRHQLPNTWLRDNCRCQDCVNQDTMQRNVDIFQMSSDVTPTQVTQDAEGVQVQCMSWLLRSPTLRLIR
jgi:hypothetical protein